MLAAVGFSYINLDRIPQAIPPLQRAAQLLSQDYLVQSQLGFCLQATGQVDAGISYLRKGASLNPTYGAEAAPAATKGRKKAFVLDPLLND